MVGNSCGHGGLYNGMLKNYAIDMAFRPCFQNQIRQVLACRADAKPLLQRWALRTAHAQMYVMQSIELIRKFLQDRLGVEAEQVMPTAMLADLGVDSLMLAELMFEAEDSLGVSIDSDMAIPKTVGDTINLLDGLLAAKDSAS